MISLSQLPGSSDQKNSRNIDSRIFCLFYTVGISSHSTRWSVSTCLRFQMVTLSKASEECFSSFFECMECLLQGLPGARGISPSPSYLNSPGDDTLTELSTTLIFFDQRSTRYVLDTYQHLLMVKHISSLVLRNYFILLSVCWTVRLKLSCLNLPVRFQKGT